MTSSTRAWLLEWPVHDIALAPCEVIEIVAEPEVHRVPLGPSWCRAVLYWRERYLPLALPRDADVRDHSIVVVAWQSAPRHALDHAAIAVRRAPLQIDVIDGLDCDPPARSIFAHAQLRACFKLEDRIIVVPELSELFAAAEMAA